MDNKNNVSSFGADLNKYVNDDKDMQKNSKAKLSDSITVFARVLNINDLVKKQTKDIYKVK